jgi:hypothetical protein
MMEFKVAILALLSTMALYKPWERVITLLCKRYFDAELSREFCVACAITLFVAIGVTLQVLLK